jgi:hypothetical protein
MDEQVLDVAVTDGSLRHQIEHAVDAALATRRTAPSVRVGLRGEGLPADVVSALVSGLRRLREVGGWMIVEPRTAAVRDGLVLHGLDRVFAAPIAVEPPAGWRRKASRIAAAGLALVALALGGFAAARADDAVPPATPSPAISADAALVLERVIARNPDLSSYQGRMHLEIAMQSFPFMHQHLEATTYYKRPSNYEVVFDRLPSYARGFEKLYTDVGDASNWDKRFVVTYEGETPYENRRDLVLRLVQRVRGMIDHETVLVDPATFTIDQIRYDYYNGGHITMSQQFRSIGGYALLVAQRAEIAIPHVRATAIGTYDSYQTNVALDDAVFAKKQ